MQPILRVNHLSKNFNGILAVDDLSFEVFAGDIYGFLGQNGAGKSTTIRMLLSLVRPDAGEIEIFGMNLHSKRKEILQKTGAVIERPDLYKYLTAMENLSLFAKMSGVYRTKQQLLASLEQVGLAERAESKVRTYSQGMKQRLGIVIALVHDPGLVILDEPTNGLDPQGIADIRNLILHLSKNQGKTVFLSSHLLSEIELIANRMLIIDKGKKIIEGEVQELFDPGQMLVEISVLNPGITKRCIEDSGWQQFLSAEQNNTFIFRMAQKDVPALTRTLADCGAELLSVQPKHSLEEYFLSLTSNSRHVETFSN